MTQEDRDKFIALEIDVKHTKDYVTKIDEKVSNVERTVTKMAQKLFKDDETGEEGYFSIIKSNRMRLSKLENIKVAVIAILMTLGGVFGWVAKSILK